MGIFSADEHPIWSEVYQNHQVKDEAIKMLDDLMQSLSVPAAEYVPAIGEAFGKIDAIKDKLRSMI